MDQTSNSTFELVVEGLGAALTLGYAASRGIKRFREHRARAKGEPKEKTKVRKEAGEEGKEDEDEEE